MSAVEIRDIVYSNNSDMPFAVYLMTNYGSLLLTFECKNTNELDADDINQLDRAGLFARPERLARFAERQDPERGDRGEPRRQRVAEPCRQGVIPRVARAVPEGKDPNHRRMGGDGR